MRVFAAIAAVAVVAASSRCLAVSAGEIGGGQATTAPAEEVAVPSQAAPSARGGGKEPSIFTGQAVLPPQGSSQETLARLLLDRPPVPLSRPLDLKAPAAVVPDLPPEGSMVVDRRCRVAYDERTGWHVLTIDDPLNRSELHPRAILFSSLLEKVEEVLAGNPQAVFRISGENAVCEQRCYILLRKVTVLESQGGGSTDSTGSTNLPQTGSQQAGPPQASPPPTGKVAGTEGRATAGDIMQQLLKEKPGKAIMVPVRDPGRIAPSPSVAPAGAVQELPPDRGDLKIDRIVRFVPGRTSWWWTARFEADNTLQEPPLRLLPSSQLERAKRLHETTPQDKPCKFRVTGEITEYKGRRYLFLRKLFFEEEMGKF